MNLDVRAWNSINGPNFAYADGGVAAITHGRASLEWDPRFNARGFVCEYATASLEEDSNSITSWLFVNDPGFWEMVYGYPKLHRKVRLVIEFYGKISPEITEDYLRRIGA